MNPHPPKWADRFLAWYCNPDLLEEIQGDAQELYFERLKRKGKTVADWKYIWDVIRFLRWSNIKRESNHHTSNYLQVLWNLNVKIALRNAFKNRLTFSVKMFGLSVCLAFALVLMAFIIQEFTFDQHFAGHERIFRIGSQVDIAGTKTRYAVSPVALADGLAEEVPEVEFSGWVKYGGNPAFVVEDKTFNNELALIASSEFLKTLPFEFIQGTFEALDEPNKIVLSETTAAKFFGKSEALGQFINIGWTELEVAAIIRDLPENIHLHFDAMISANTYEINEGWDNVNAYTYIKLTSEANMATVSPKIAACIAAHHDDMVSDREYWAGNDVSVSPIIENITAIHLGDYLDEDIAEKSNKTNIYILVGVIIVFFTMGLINFLNLSLAELTANLKKMSILKVFGGSSASHSKVTITNAAISILIVVPLTALLTFISLLLAESWLSIEITEKAFVTPYFIGTIAAFLLIFLVASRVNSLVASRTNDIIQSLKGKFNKNTSGLRTREFLVAAQISFSMIMLALMIIIVNQFQYITTIDKGIEDKNTIVVKIRDNNLGTATVFLESLRTINGIKNADVTSYHLDNIETKEFFEVDTDQGLVKMLVAYMNCGYEYLETMNIKIEKGRNFLRDHNDDKTTYIINEAAANEFGWENPIGKEIHGPLGSDRDAGEVIGVMKDFHFTSLHKQIEPLIIFLTNEAWGARYAYIKLNPIHPENILATIEDSYNKVYTDEPFEWEYLDSKFDSLYKDDYTMRDVFRIGLVISILVSGVGIFSLSALLMTTRQKEMGIRKVVGASALQLFTEHILPFIKFMILAILVAWPTIYFLSQHWLDNFAYHIDLNIGYFVLPCLISLAIVFVMSAYHGVRNAQVNPVDILKHE